MRVFDRVHGDLVFPEFVERLVRTPEFQRLDRIRQLGGCSFVYPSATHTRLEHSLGVCHLARVLGEHLQRLRPDLVSTDDVVCLQLAGLLHDLGHGPFSHLFEEFVREKCDATWSHETMTLQIMDLLLERVDVSSAFEEGVYSEHVAFVKLLVVGHDPASPWPTDIGRTSDRAFLAEVIHNRTTGIDVDKLDYLARDALAVLGITHAYDVHRVLNAVRIVSYEQSVRLAFDERVAFSLSETYALRARLHRQVYQHRTVLLVEGGLKDLFEARWEDLETCLYDPEQFVHVVDATLLSTPGSVRDALYRVPQTMRRVPVTACPRTVPSCHKCYAETRIQDAFCPRCGASTETRRGVVVDGRLVPSECTVTAAQATRDLQEMSGVEGVRVHVVDVHCGQVVSVLDPYGRAWRDHDPLHAVLFCATDDPVPVRMAPAAFFAPAIRHVITAHCYVPHSTDDETVATVTTHFRQWAYRRGLPVEEEA
jgi:HD superfamily phosphohydrolase